MIPQLRTEGTYLGLKMTAVYRSIYLALEDCLPLEIVGLGSLLPPHVKLRRYRLSPGHSLSSGLRGCSTSRLHFDR